MVQAPGAFVCLGLILAGMNFLTMWQAKRKGQTVDPILDAGCKGCSACRKLDEIANQKKLEKLQPAKG